VLFAEVGSFSSLRENFRLTDELKAKFTKRLQAQPREFASKDVAQVVHMDSLKMKFLRAIVRGLFSRRQWLATGCVAVFAGWLFYHVMFGANGMMAYQQKVREYERLQQEVRQAQVENERLRQRVNSLKTDPQAIEKEAREQLKYAKPGELIYVYPAPKVESIPSTATAQKH
jgi:cell division protein FtsB